MLCAPSKLSLSTKSYLRQPLTSELGLVLAVPADTAVVPRAGGALAASTHPLLDLLAAVAHVAAGRARRGRVGRGGEGRRGALRRRRI